MASSVVFAGSVEGRIAGLLDRFRRNGADGRPDVEGDRGETAGGRHA
jgi:hypothetical protein